jgi:hypothetical protein
VFRSGAGPDECRNDGGIVEFDAVNTSRAQGVFRRWLPILSHRHHKKWTIGTAEGQKAS